jgi:hypothetical protein
MRGLMHGVTRRAIFIALALVLAACSGGKQSQPPSPSASGTAVTGASPSAADPTPRPSPSQLISAPTILPTEALARVTVETIAIHEEASQASSVVAKLKRGELVYVAAIAAEVDGNVWYPVIAGFETWPGLDKLGEDYVRGSILGGQTGVETLELEAVACSNGQPTLEMVAALTAWGRLACFGARELTLTSVIDIPCCNPPGGYVPEPFWLAKAIPGFLAGLVFHIDPASGLEAPERGQVVAMIGHFDDPAAATCSTTLDTSAGPTHLPPLVAEAVVLSCREQFVATRYEVVGTESMPPCC